MPARVLFLTQRVFVYDVAGYESEYFAPSYHIRSWRILKAFSVALSTVQSSTNQFIFGAESTRAHTHTSYSVIYKTKQTSGEGERTNKQTNKDVRLEQYQVPVSIPNTIINN